MEFGLADGLDENVRRFQVEVKHAVGMRGGTARAICRNNCNRAPQCRPLRRVDIVRLLSTRSIGHRTSGIEYVSAESGDVGPAALAKLVVERRLQLFLQIARAVAPRMPTRVSPRLETEEILIEAVHTDRIHPKLSDFGIGAQVAQQGTPTTRRPYHVVWIVGHINPLSSK